MKKVAAFVIALAASTSGFTQTVSVADGPMPMGIAPGTPGSYGPAGMEHYNPFSGALSVAVPLCPPSRLSPSQTAMFKQSGCMSNPQLQTQKTTLDDTSAVSQVSFAYDQFNNVEFNNGRLRAQSRHSFRGWIKQGSGEAGHASSASSGRHVEGQGL